MPQPQRLKTFLGVFSINEKNYVVFKIFCQNTNLCLKYLCF
ncbi:protein of unknown function [Oenococcus oeni]|nr:protein of unknown function [Oenococcus oeni]